MLIRHTLLYLPAQLLAPLAQLVSIILWTHWLSPLEMGHFTLVTVTQELTQLLGMSWFSSYVLRYWPSAEQTDERARFLATERVVLWAFVAASVLVAVGTSAWLRGEAWGPGSWSVVAYFVTRASNVHYAERARAQAAFGAYTVLQTVGPVLGLALGWLGMRVGPPAATTLWWAYAVAQGLGTLAALPLLGVARGWKKPDARVLKAAFGFGGPLLALGGLAWAAENVLRYQVQWQLGAPALGLMAVGWGLGRRCASVASMLVATAAFPLASRLLNEGRRDEAMAQLRVNAALLLAVLLPVSTAMFFLGQPLLGLVVAPQYREVSTQIMALAVLSGALRNLQLHTCCQALVLERRFASVAWVSGVEIAANVAAAALGLALAGLPGAVAGAAVGAAVALVLSAFMAQRQLGFHWPWLDLVRISAACAVMGLALSVHSVAATWFDLVYSSAVAAALYLLLLAQLYAPLWREPLAQAWRQRVQRSNRLKPAPLAAP